ncbi:hypothetical protein LJK87_00285 [Paenibacillus sp. P25]|nr:hypothetical protein LJK87_00285 [Paenibacillus sp. P25]
MDTTFAGIHQKSRPTLAILTYADEKRVFRGNQKNFIDLIRVGEEWGMNVYVMTTSDFKLSGKQAVGYTYNPLKKTWVRGLAAPPYRYLQPDSLPQIRAAARGAAGHPDLSSAQADPVLQSRVLQQMDALRMAEPVQ